MDPFSISRPENGDQDDSYVENVSLLSDVENESADGYNYDIEENTYETSVDEIEYSGAQGYDYYTLDEGHRFTEHEHDIYDVESGVEVESLGDSEWLESTSYSSLPPEFECELTAEQAEQALRYFSKSILRLHCLVSK